MSARNDYYDLTERQGEILDFLKEEIREKQLPPSRAEIAMHFGWRSANSADEHLRAMARKGVIDLVPGISRGIRVKV